MNVDFPTKEALSGAIGEREERMFNAFDASEIVMCTVSINGRPYSNGT
jgi:hypothetical protein